MRTTIILLIFLSTISCTESNQKVEAENDRLELVPEPDKELREKYEQQATDSIEQEFMGEELKPIREKLKPITESQRWTTIDKRRVDFGNSNGAVEYYLLDEELQKIRLHVKTDSTERIVEYYLENDNLFFVFEKQINKNELKNNPEYYDPLEDSLFFDKKELIRIKSNLDCGAPFAEEYRKQEQNRLKNEFENLKLRLNGKGIN